MIIILHYFISTVDFSVRRKSNVKRRCYSLLNAKHLSIFNFLHFLHDELSKINSYISICSHETTTIYFREEALRITSKQLYQINGFILYLIFGNYEGCHLKYARLVLENLDSELYSVFFLL